MSTNDLCQLPNPDRFRTEALRFLGGLDLPIRDPDLLRIKRICAGFNRLPFENLSKLIKLARDPGHRMRYPDEVLDDHLAYALGGTCFALSYYLLAILQEQGFEAEPLLCHMGWGENVHTAVRIILADRHYLVDPGYLILQPLPLNHRSIQQPRGNLDVLELTFHEETATYTISTRRGSQRTRRYWFQDRSVDLLEFGEKWEDSFASPLLEGICLTRTTAQRMIYIQDDYARVTLADRVEKGHDENRVKTLIREEFGIPLEQVEAARALLLPPRRKMDLP